MKETISKAILYTYFENRATEYEKLLIKEWLKEEGNEEIFYQHLATWEASHMQFTPDQKKANKRYEQFLSGEVNNPSHLITPVKKRILFPKKKIVYTSIAASVIGLLCTIFFLSQDYFLYDVYASGYGMTKNVLLKDGSEITLNANSTVKVPKDIATRNIREVWLSGEAFFSIAKRPNHIRFAVHTNQLNVEVLGTQFNVNTRRGKTEVVLSEGSIKLTSARDSSKAAYLKPGDYVSLSKNDTTLKRKVVKPEKYMGWQSNKLIFEDTPLRVVAEKIEDYYGVNIEIESTEIANRQVTGTLPNNDLGIVLKSLSTSHNLEIQRKDDKIIFR